MLLIVGLLAGTAWLARKVSGGKGFGHGGMRVIGGVALGPRERIVLVEIGDTWLVIGIVPGQIRTLHKIPKDSSSLEMPGEQGVNSSAFEMMLKRISGKDQPA